MREELASILRRDVHRHLAGGVLDEETQVPLPLFIQWVVLALRSRLGFINALPSLGFSGALVVAFGAEVVRVFWVVLDDPHEAPVPVGRRRHQNLADGSQRLILVHRPGHAKRNLPRHLVHPHALALNVVSTVVGTVRRGAHLLVRPQRHLPARVPCLGRGEPRVVRLGGCPLRRLHE